MPIKKTLQSPPRDIVKNYVLSEFFTQVCDQINLLTTYIRLGDGTPEGSETAEPGSIYLNKTIASGEYALYIKRTGSGNTGWEGLGTVLP